MTLIYEYGERREQIGIEKGREENTENIIRNLLISGIDPQKIAKTTKVPLSKINKIKEKYEL